MAKGGLKILGGSVAKGQRVKAAAKGLSALKMECKTKYRFFLRTVADEDTDKLSVLAVTLPSRALGEELNCNSSKVLSDWDYDEDTGRVIDNSELPRYARMAAALHRADCEAAKVKKERDMKSDAMDAGEDIAGQKFITDLNMELVKIETQYFGNKELNAYADKHQVIGSTRFSTTTELAVVPLSSSGAPEWSKADVFTWDITSQRRKSMLEDAASQAEGKLTAGDFIELHVNYGMDTTDKNQASKNMTLSLVNKDDSLASIDPSGYEKFVADVASRIASDPEVMAMRSAIVKFSKPDEVIIEEFKRWVSSKPAMVNQLDFESEDVKKVAKDLHETGLIAFNHKAQEKLVELLNSMEDSGDEGSAIDELYKEDNGSAEDDAIQASHKEVEEAKAIQGMLAAANSNTAEASESTGDASALNTSDIDNI